VYAAPTVATTYTVTATDVATGCFSTASVLVNYTPPAPTVTPNPVTMCLGDPAVKLKSSSSQSFSNTFSSGTVNVVIPDGPTIPPVPTSYPASVSNITVSGIPAGATITGVRARFNITHAYVGDCVMALKAPNGQIFNLDAMLNRTNNPGANFTNTVISSAGTNLLSAGTAPFTNTYKADAAGATFTAFGFTFPGGPVGYIPTTTNYSDLYATCTPNGVWSIGIYDAGAPDAGVLNNWSLDIDYTVGVVASAAQWSPAAGLFSDAAATVPYVLGTRVDSVWTRPTPSGVYNYQVTVNNVVSIASNITTPMLGGNCNNLVAFNIRNNNAVPVTFSSISSNVFTSGTNATARVFYKPGAIAGNPGAISAANGWTQFGTATVPTVTA
jgi:subtilisin-like proprotein convertase family protein